MCNIIILNIFMVQMCNQFFIKQATMFVLKRSYYSGLVASSKSPLKIIKFKHYMCLVILTVENMFA